MYSDFYNIIRIKEFSIEIPRSISLNLHSPTAYLHKIPRSNRNGGRKFPRATSPENVIVWHRGWLRNGAGRFLSKVVATDLHIVERRINYR